jgi:hypothetical protein
MIFPDPRFPSGRLLPLLHYNTRRKHPLEGTTGREMELVGLCASRGFGQRTSCHRKVQRLQPACGMQILRDVTEVVQRCGCRLTSFADYDCVLARKRKHHCTTPPRVSSCDPIPETSGNEFIYFQGKEIWSARSR